jgi:hypothetical protein
MSITYNRCFCHQGRARGWEDIPQPSDNQDSPGPIPERNILFTEGPEGGNVGFLERESSMVTTKAAHSRHADIRTQPALSRSPARSGGPIRSLAVCEAVSEEELLEQIEKMCLEYCQNYSNQVEINSYQAVPPEAVSLMEPPERAWLVRLHTAGQGQEQTAGEVEVMAILQGGELSIIFR